jgi:hypothetical protein
MRAGDDDHREDAGHTKPETYGEQVRAGVARAALLDRLLREPRVMEELGTLASMAAEARADETLDRTGGPLAWAVSLAQRTTAGKRLALDRMAALAQELGLEWIGPWLPEFLEAAAHFRRTLEAEDLHTCALADPGLAAARDYVRSLEAEPERDPWVAKAPVIRFFGGVLPTTEPTEWATRTPDWIELYASLVEHAAERLDWTSEATGADRLWPFLLHSTFDGDVDLGDDPEVLHGLVGLWANTCHQTIDAHTRPRLPRGRVPDSGGFYRDGRPREGGRDKIRRWVSWYVDKEITHAPFNDILQAAFPNSAAPLERSSEARRHIREAKQLLALELPLDARQPVRLWKLAQAYRPLLELLLPTGGEIS